MHDALTVEKAGKPAACICSEPFVPTARAVAKVRGIEDYPFVTISHPIGTLDLTDLMERAKQALPQVLQILLGK